MFDHGEDAITSQRFVSRYFLHINRLSGESVR